MFLKYFENDLSPLALHPRSKKPIDTGWSRWCEHPAKISIIERWDDQFQKYPNSLNIGLACGPGGKVVGLDIDEPELKRYCPPSPVVRGGKPGRELRVFRYTENIESKRYPGLDILANGRQFVVPPSIHPEGYPYRWLSPDTLENFKIEDLPVLDLSFLSSVPPELFEKQKISGSGRNDDLKKIVCAMRAREELEHIILDEVYRRDFVYHTPRLFTDKSEGYPASSEDDARRNAWRFVNSVSATIIKNKLAPIPGFGKEMILDLSSGEERPPARKFQAREFMKPDGLLGDIVELTLEAGEDRTPILALGGAIAAVAALACNRFRILNLWPNVYVLNVATTGGGKSYPQSVAKHLLCEEVDTDLIESGGANSSSALIEGFREKREQLYLIDEISSFFLLMTEGGPWQRAMLNQLCQLWSESNQKFLGKKYAQKQETATCYNPCLNIFGATTHAEFKKTVRPEFISSGFLPRFLIFCQDNYGEFNPVQRMPEDLLRKIVKQVKMLSEMPKPTDPRPDKLVGDRYRPVETLFEGTSAYQVYLELREEFNDRKRGEQDSVQLQLITRGKEHIMKLALIHAVGMFEKRGEVKIHDSDFIWARHTFETCAHNAHQLLTEVGATNEFERDKIRMIAHFERKGFLTMRDLTVTLRNLDSKRIKSIIENLVASEVIVPGQVPGKGSRPVDGYHFLNSLV